MQEITVSTPDYLGCTDVRVTIENSGEVHVSVREHGQRSWEHPDTMECTVTMTGGPTGTLTAPTTPQEPLEGLGSVPVLPTA